VVLGPTRQLPACDQGHAGLPMNRGEVCCGYKVVAEIPGGSIGFIQMQQTEQEDGFVRWARARVRPVDSEQWAP
jgi:hypothetical protein